MILLRHDCLAFKNAEGESIPGSATEFAVELIGEALTMLDEEIVTNAAHAVLHYFKEELGRTTINIGEFSNALEETLQKLGFKIKAAPPEAAETRVVTTNLDDLALKLGIGYE